MDITHDNMLQLLLTVHLISSFSLYVYFSLCFHCIFTVFSEGYTYQWSLVERPEGNEYGNMDGINTSELKLSKVTIARIAAIKQLIEEAW